MKRIFLFLLCVCGLFTLASGALATESDLEEIVAEMETQAEAAERIVYAIGPWRYVLNENEGQDQDEIIITVTLTEYHGEEPHVEIPESIVHEDTELAVVAVGDDAFRENTTLQSVYCPDTLLTIGERAFSGCGNLSEVRLPSGLLKLEHYLFSQCYALSSIELPPTLESIGLSTFEGCTSLEAIVIPETVANIRSDAFHGCTSLQTVEYLGNVDYFGGHVFTQTPYLAAIEDEFVILGNRILVQYNGKDSIVTVPSWVRSIVGAFENCTFIEEVILPQSLTNIGCYAFSGCTSLKEITLPPNVRNIEEHAFSGCINLKNIAMNESLVYIGDSAFRNCRAIVSIVLPETVTTIEARAFYGCTRLSHINLPVRLEQLGSSAFKDCKALTSVALYQNLTKLSSSAFDGTQLRSFLVVYGSLAEQYAKEHKLPYDYVEQYTPEYAYIRDEQGIVIRQYMGEDFEVILPDTLDDVPVYAIGSGAFQGQEHIVAVYLSNNIRTIRDWAFSWCAGLERIELSDTLGSIGSDAFRNCSALAYVYLPDSIQAIGNDVFTGCEQATIFADHDSDAQALLAAQGIETLDALTEGGEWIFEKEDGRLWVKQYVGAERAAVLPALYTGREIAGILSGAFIGTQLDSVTISGMLERIDAGAFTGIDANMHIYFMENVQEIEEDAFAAESILHAYTGTTVEEYARKHGNKFLVMHR